MKYPWTCAWCGRSWGEVDVNGSHGICSKCIKEYGEGKYAFMESSSCKRWKIFICY